MNQGWKKSVLLKKLYRYCFNIFIRPCLISFTKNTVEKRPPIVINSFPKSGTHLLTQIISALPNYTDRGNFLASTPSVTLRVKSPSTMRRLLLRLLPGEISSAHLHFSPEAREAIQKRSICHLFIYRDPRDVCISEAHYLASMNKFHRLHKYVKKEPGIESKINLTINGFYKNGFFGFIYPRIDKRFSLYEDWISDPNTLPIRYEDLIGDNQKDQIEKIAKFLFERNVIIESEIDSFVRLAQSSISPENSHTFRSGQTNQWITGFSEQQKLAFSLFGEDLIKRLNYRPTLK